MTQTGSDPATRRRNTTILKVLVVVAFFSGWLFVYKFFNNWNADPIRAIRFDRPVDLWPSIIQPWTAYIYVFAGYAIPLLPFWWYRSWSRIGFVLGVYLVSSVLAFVIYWFYPLAIARPPFLGDRLGEDLMRTVVSVDNDANCCPSFHTSFAIMAAMLVSQGGSMWSTRIAIWMLAIAISISTVTTGQHYVVDVFGGVVLALFSYHGTAWLAGDPGNR